jgi:pimeloyl-ACP methyl ester carboxylesterase
LPLALEQFESRNKPAKMSLRELLRLDPDQARPAITDVAAGTASNRIAVICINGNETDDWRNEARFLEGLVKRGHAVAVVDPRGVASRRSKLRARGYAYTDPLGGVEANLAYNAFLVGKSLLGMRVTDVLVAVRKVRERTGPLRIVVCGRRDAALAACLAAAVEPTIDLIATEEMIQSFSSFFNTDGAVLSAASIVPGLLQRFGDVAQVLAQIAPRRVLVAAGVGPGLGPDRLVQAVPGRFTQNCQILTDWINDR